MEEFTRVNLKGSGELVKRQHSDVALSPNDFPCVGPVEVRTLCKRAHTPSAVVAQSLHSAADGLQLGDVFVAWCPVLAHPGEQSTRAEPY